MNLPLISSGMINFILAFLGALVAVGLTLYACHYKFKDTKTRKRLIIFYLSLTGLVVAYLLSYTVSCIIGRYQVEKKLSRMQAEGVPMSLNTIKPPLPAKADNGIQYYEAAQKLIKCSSYETLTGRYMENNDSRLNYSTCDLACWDKADQQAAVRLLSNKEIDMIFDLFHQGAQKQAAVYDRDYSKGFATLLPELNSHRALFRLLYMKSSAYGLEGKTAAGYTLIQDGFRAAKQFEADPLIISQLVNIACTVINIEAMNSLLTRYGIDDQTAQQLINVLSQLDVNRSMLNALDCEVMMTSDFFVGIMTGRSDVEELASSFFDVKPIKLAASGPFIYWDYNYYLTKMQKVRTLLKQPYWQNVDKINALWNESIPHRYPASLNLFGSWAIQNTASKVARTDSEIIGAWLSLALHIYKNQHGTFPAKLELLVPAILKNIPVDPINGKPFEYRRNGNSFILSSVWLKEKAEMDKRKALRSKNNNTNKASPK